MRNILLASVATLATGGLTGAAWAQAPAAPAAPVGAPSQGQVAYPAAPAPVSYVNSNNNYQASALPGPLANPTPGTIVIHINGKVQVDISGAWTSADTVFHTAPAAGTTAALLGNNGTGVTKLQPQAIDSFARLYFGADGMATNGLRYGAAIELRQNFIGEQSGSSASTYTSAQTMFVRRAFTYVAGDQWGIVRAGEADGLIGIFDNGVTTFQFLPTGNFNGGDSQSVMPGGVAPTWVWMSQAGGEYGNAKLVYISPQIAGFDFGLQYAPNTSNGFGNSSPSDGGLSGSLIGSGNGTGVVCSVSTTGCPSLSAGPGSLDGSRIINQYAAGIRYQGSFNGLGVLAYAVYEGSGNADYTGASAATAAGRANLGISGLPTSKYTGQYKGLSVGSGGIALTFAGLTVGANVIGGRKNGYVALQPVGAVHQLGVIGGVKYVAGPLTVGVALMDYWDQGNVQMTGLSQHHAYGINPGLSYSVAPGYTVYAEYLWNEQRQSGVNQLTGATGSSANNAIKGQAILVGNVVNF